MHHTGGWTVGNLDEFEGAMRIIAEESGHQVSHCCFFNAFGTCYMPFKQSVLQCCNAVQCIALQCNACNAMYITSIGVTGMLTHKRGKWKVKSRCYQVQLL